MAKKVFYDAEAREKILGGAKALYDAVKVTFGPKGRNVIIEKSYGAPTITHDGVTVAEAVELPKEDDATLGYEMGAKLIKTAGTGRILRDGLMTAIVGKPNVGKSSLLNALLQEERASVTDIPGTTRDTVEGEIMIDGIRVHFTDTAGLRETEDPIEKIGVERSEQAVRNADMTLLVLDGSRKLTDEEVAGLRALLR